MSRLDSPWMAVATATFVASTGLLALSSRPEASGLLEAMLSPDNPVSWLLLLAIWAGLVLRAAPPLGGEIGPRQNPDALPVALLTAALWPWLIGVLPGLALLLATVMVAAALHAAFQRIHDAGEYRRSAVAAGFAGWATLVFFVAIAGIAAPWGLLGGSVLGVICIALCALTGMVVQTRLGHSAAYAGVMIWGLAGLVASTMATSPSVSIILAIGIAALAVVLVRAAS